MLTENLSFPLKVDCFASRLNFKLENFFSRYPDPLSSWVNAFSVRWSDNLYLFPPIPIIHRVISKFISDNTAHGLLICPYWPSQFWFPSLLELLIAPPILIPSAMILDENHRLPRSCLLMACSIGCNHAEHMGFLESLESVGSKVSKEKLLLDIKKVGEGSVIGISNGKTITVQLL